MKRDDIVSFLHLLNAREVRHDSEWLRCCCPLEKWRHQEGVDRTPSFGIRISEDKPSAYFCFSCGCHGSLMKLVPSLWFLTGEYPTELAAFIVAKEFLQEEYELEMVKVHPDRLQAPREVVAVPEEVLANLPFTQRGDEVFEYLMLERRLSLQSLYDFQIRVYRSPWGSFGAVFPIIDGEGKTVDLYVRTIKGKSFFRLNAELTGSSVEYHAPHLCFGNHLLDRNQKTTAIGEAPLDVMRLYSLSKGNVLATCGPPRKAQMYNLWVPPPIVLAFDDDEAGKRHGKSVVRNLMRGFAINFIRLPWGVVGKKDANEIENGIQLREVVKARKEYFRDVRL